MITINLQWLSTPFFLLALYELLVLVARGIPLAFKGGLESVIGFIVIQDCLMWGVGAALIGWLIHYAFRH